MYLKEVCDLNEKEKLTHYGHIFQHHMALQDEFSGDGESTRPFQVRQDTETDEWLLGFSMPDLLDRHLRLFNLYGFKLHDAFASEDETIELRLKLKAK